MLGAVVLNQDIYILELTPQVTKKDSFPSSPSEFESWNYELVCTVTQNEIGEAEFEDLKDTATIVDVREFGEQPELSFPHLHIPLSHLEDQLNEITGETIIFLCQSGIRSKKAMEIYSSQSHSSNNVYSLKGGILKLTALAR